MGTDHTDALTDALRQPALPAEHIGEKAAVAAMTGAMTSAAAPRRFRSRTGVAVVAITAASLGVGGLAAADPGVFPALLEFAGRSERSDTPLPALESSTRALGSADFANDLGAVRRTDATMLDGTMLDGTMLDGAATATVDEPSAGAASDVEVAGPDEAGACADAAHGEQVAEAARTTDPDAADVDEVARDNCGNTGSSENSGDNPGDNNGTATPGRPADPNPNASPGNNNGNGNTDPGQPVEPGQPIEPGNNGNTDPATDANGSANGIHGKSVAGTESNDHAIGNNGQDSIGEGKP